MHLCYIDESGTPEATGNTSQYVLAGIAIPVGAWKRCDSQIEKIKNRFHLSGSEIHTAWIMRPYIEQKKIPNFESMKYSQRRSKVESFRKGELLRLQRKENKYQFHQTKKNYRQTQSYVHLTIDERKQFLLAIAKQVSTWHSARLFAECIDKVNFDKSRAGQDVDEQAFEQVISRFDHYLQIVNIKTPEKVGLLIHDNNQTVAKKHTLLMKKYHEKGTRWTKLKHIIETPLFVSSELTSMVQVADLCSYALRRYLENQEKDLFQLIFKRADRKNNIAVGIRHFPNEECSCEICISHNK